VSLWGMEHLPATIQVLTCGVIGGVRRPEGRFKLAAPDQLLGYKTLKYLFVGHDSFCTPGVDSTTPASDNGVCLVSFGSSSRRSEPMGCPMSPRMDSESDDEQEAAEHAPVASGATPPAPLVRRKPTTTPLPPVSLSFWRVSSCAVGIVCSACLFLHVIIA
jgi:hypothetical protein